VESLRDDIANLEREHNNLLEELNEFSEDFEIKSWKYCMKLEEEDEERKNKVERAKLREYWEEKKRFSY
jgi:hypothetical protein